MGTAGWAVLCICCYWPEISFWRNPNSRDEVALRWEEAVIRYRVSLPCQVRLAPRPGRSIARPFSIHGARLHSACEVSTRGRPSLPTGSLCHVGDQSIAGLLSILGGTDLHPLPRAEMTWGVCSPFSVARTWPLWALLPFPVVSAPPHPIRDCF